MFAFRFASPFSKMGEAEWHGGRSSVCDNRATPVGDTGDGGDAANSTNWPRKETSLRIFRG